MNDALPGGNRLRFASVPDSMRRVITDSSGIKYVNLRNKDIQEILKVVPQALSNPLKNRLLEAYLKLEDYQIHDARVLLTELLKTDDLISLANADTAPFTQKICRFAHHEYPVGNRQVMASITFLLGAGFSAPFDVPTMSPFLWSFRDLAERKYPQLFDTLVMHLGTLGNDPDLESLLSSLGKAERVLEGLPQHT